jgi:DNA repair protein RecN (Recombination protein N)
MLTYLRIKDFALIDSLELELAPGLTVLSGETGAGKSIILAAVNLLLGQRASGDLIRAGAEQAVVEAQFSLALNSPLRPRLEELGLDEGADEDLVLRRVVSAGGRNRVQVGGALSTLSLLGEVGPRLVSLCGQHSHQLLLRPAEHLLLLDAFAGLGEERTRLTSAVRQAQELQRREAELARTLARREERRVYLEHVVAEIEGAGLDAAEEEALKAERRRLANAEQLARLAEQAHQGLYAADQGSALEVLGRVRGLLAELARLDEGLAGLSAQVEEAYYSLEDAAGVARDYAARVVFDPARLDQVEARLLALQRLGRKYGGSVEDALRSLDEARVELGSLDQGDQHLAQLAREKEAALAQALTLAQALSRARREAAISLAQAASAELKELGMSACRFEARFSPPEGAALETVQGPLGLQGLEQAEFYIAPNPGEGFKALARIASGGELSRMLLGLRSLVAAQEGAPTLIFDEVDAGIGGATGSVVGRKLKALAGNGQVICITHLPQIAAWADYHISVRKETRGGRTVTVLEPLDDAGRLTEMARMLGDGQGQEAARAHAASMLAATGREARGKGEPARAQRP